MEPKIPDDDAELLRAAIAHSGMPDRRFAILVLVRDERTVRKWLTRKHPLPRVVRNKLVDYLLQPPGEARVRPQEELTR